MANTDKLRNNIINYLGIKHKHNGSHFIKHAHSIPYQKQVSEQFWGGYTGQFFSCKFCIRIVRFIILSLF